MFAGMSLSWKVSILQLLKNQTLTVFELQDWLWDQRKRTFVIYKVTESFSFHFLNSDKNCNVWNVSFLVKKTFLWKKIVWLENYSEIRKKALCSFVDHETLFRLIYISQKFNGGSSIIIVGQVGKSSIVTVDILLVKCRFWTHYIFRCCGGVIRDITGSFNFFCS